MFRYYMTAATRQAVIAESNRLIATRHAVNATRRPNPADGSAECSDSEWHRSHGDAEAMGSEMESTFARLVSDLKSTSAAFKLS